MHDAYEAAPILEKLPLQIESVACYGDTLLVGTKQGHLVVYSVRPTNRPDPRFEVNVERSNKAFSKKPITQLSVVPEYHILISLSDGIISVHDLTVFTQITAIPKTRGATLFAIDLQRQQSLSGESQYTLRMCVVVRKKLQLFYWKNREFKELQQDISLQDIPKSMTWCKDSLCVGFKREYYLIKVETGVSKEVFPTGSKTLEPVITRLEEEDRLALGRDNQSIFIDSEGNPTCKYALTWSEMPQVIVHNSPYLIAVLPKYVEIRTIEPRLLIQSIELQKPRMICQSTNRSDVIYVAATNHVWRLMRTPITTQIKQLLHSKEFELALHLANMTEEAPSDKNRRLQYIRNLYAFELFCQHRFEESLKIFGELGTDPSHVVGLYPNLLPQDFKNQLEYPDKLPTLEGVELEKGLLALVDYLMFKRNELSKDSNKQLVSAAIVEGSTTIRSKKLHSQIIDTTLLKCYINTNDALVAPLLRLPDNNCHIDECERVLNKHKKYSELIILYEKKGLHKKALDLLLRQAAKPNSQLKGHDRTVQYLQRLGSDHVDLIFEYSEWVLKEHPEDGLKIFTEDMTEVETLPRDKVLDYLEKVARNLVIPYLEHVIFAWHEEYPLFHNSLALQYKDKICNLVDNDPRAIGGKSPTTLISEDTGELGKYKTKLITFLETSTFYEPERLLAHFPYDGFYEERAVLLGGLGRHEQALAIYVHILRKPRMAEDYCKRHYDTNNEGNKEVFLHLLNMYLKPPDPNTLGVVPLYNMQVEPDTDAALKLLQEHGNKLDTIKALELLPPHIKVKDVLVFLENVLEDKSGRKRDAQVLKSLRYSEHLQMQEQRMFYHKIKCIITEERMCRVCKKRIGNSAFARYPNGVIVHYFCCKDPSVCPGE